MTAFLADENISPDSAAHLEALGHDCRSLLRDGPRSLSDSEVVALARREDRVIITHDLDFGEIYHAASDGEVGVLVLRLRHQTVEAVNRVLERFLGASVLSESQIRRTLVILSEDAYRVYKGQRGRF